MTVKTLRNEKGIALITALLLTLISLLVLMAVVYLVTRGIEVSAAHKRYRTVVEATHGGAEVFTKEVIGKSFGSPTAVPTLDPILGAAFARYTGCFVKKLHYKTSEWQARGCGADAKVVDPKVKPDMQFTLQGLPSQPNFKVYSKIVDSIPGNTDGSGVELLEGGSGVAYGANSSAVAPQHIPSLFRVEVQGEREVNPAEKARLTVLYAY